jgi:hypothetical protein
VQVELSVIQRYDDLLFSMSRNLPTMLDWARWELRRAHFQALRAMLNISYGYAEVHHP